MRAVLDVNVVISGVLSPAGPPARVLRAWIEGAFELVASPALVEELDRALAYPKVRARIPEDRGRNSWNCSGVTRRSSTTRGRLRASGRPIPVTTTWSRWQRRRGR
jgi:predicted nucleic acid-binding protein